MSPVANAARNPAASFVHGLAWTFIGVSAVSALLAAMIYALFAHLLPQEPLRATFADAISLKLLPPSALQLLDYLPAVSLTLFALTLLALLVSIALLRLKPWARIAFAWIMIATALAHFAGVVLPFYLLRDASAMLNAMPPDIRGFASNMITVMSVISAGMGIAFGLAFAWVARQFLSAEIAQEFASDKRG